MLDRGTRRKISTGPDGDLVISLPGYPTKRGLAATRARQLESLLQVVLTVRFDDMNYIPDGLLTDVLGLAAELSGQVVDALGNPGTPDVRGDNA
ncbi:hypothetical protein LGM54_35260 [Burkholderia cenocepacia]|uniref:hypothetical protein n=1 Tax=Burkholderia cenocepacia TaxID=95486 RepID=UPI001CF1DA12|nr:hypothetical protein [Burkholderia cenocepacia]MCA7968226.1 hypothetical protein [Burkholderia cenocepacia]